MSPTCPTVDESFARLHAAGWSVGDVRLLTAAGPRWLVTATNGENRIRASALTQAEAWHQAAAQAWELGMLGRADRERRRPSRIWPAGCERTGGAGW